MKERIQKLLANQGIASRREIERWIEAGRIVINGEMSTLGDKVSPEDTITIDGKKLSYKEPESAKVIVYHKPEGEVCTCSDPENRRTVFDNLPELQLGRWINIGRLDINTSGLILFTNDGELANKLMHPSSNIQRKYAVRVFGKPNDDTLKNLLQGIKLDEGMACFEQIIDRGGDGRNHWYHVILNEGKNREVRRLWESQGLTVSRLIRIQYGPITLPRKLKPGCYEYLSMKQIRGFF